MKGGGYPHDFFKITRKDVESAITETGGKVVNFTVSQMLGINPCQAKAQSACNNLFQSLFEELKTAEQFVLQVDNRKSVLTF